MCAVFILVMVTARISIVHHRLLFQLLVTYPFSLSKSISRSIYSFKKCLFLLCCSICSVDLWRNRSKRFLTERPLSTLKMPRFLCPSSDFIFVDFIEKLRSHNSIPYSSLQILKGHDDHVITCLQFNGSRIVSGSDDNTLKVWSAVSGKVKEFKFVNV